MPRFERFSRAGEIPGDDLMERYVRALEGIVNDHDRTSEQIAGEHAQNLDDWLRDIQEKQQEAKFGKLLDTPGNRLQKDTQYTKESTDTLFEASSKDFTASLSSQDQQVFKHVRDQADTFGPESHWVATALDSASSRQARSMMQAALDKRVWKKVQQNADTFGPESHWVATDLDAASCRQARAAMQAALDKKVWAKVQQSADTFGPESHWVSTALDAASTRHARAAMQAALDKKVWKKVKDSASTFGPESHWVSTALDASSSRQAREAMQSLLPKPSPREREEWDRAYEGIFTEDYEMPNIDDILREYFGRPSSGAGPFGTRGGQRRQQRTTGGERTQQPPRQHREEPRQRIDEEVEHIVRVAVSNGRGEKWLLNEDRIAIRRVINTVRAARDKAQKDGREITDREIYIRYRRLVDQPEGEARKEEMLKSFQILQALMGGSPSGKLPF